MPDDTVVDGEIVALDPESRPSFNALQNYGSDQTPLIYYLFDAMVLKGRDLGRAAGSATESCWRRGCCHDGRADPRLALAAGSLTN